MKGKKEKVKEKPEKNQPGPSTSSSGTRLPPVVEWLTFTMKQLKTTSNIFVKEIEGVLSEWVDKNLDELLKEEYQASRITERVVKEFHQITTKTIATLQEQDKQTKIELKERFPWIEKLGRTHGKGGGKDKKLNGTDEKATKVPEATETAGMSDAESDNELDIETDAFLNELKEKAKTAKAQSLDNKDQRSEEKEADSSEELPDLADDDAPSRRTRKKKKNKIKAEECALSDEELGLSADSDAAKAYIRAESPVSADEVGDSDTSSSADKIKSKTKKKLCSKREEESDHGSGGEEDVPPLNDSMDAETEESNDNNDDEPEIKRSKAKGKSRDVKKKQKDTEDNSKEIEEPVRKDKKKKIREFVEVDKGEGEESGKDEGVESDNEGRAESDSEALVESDKEEVVESDKEEVAESDKNEVVESDKDEVVESDKDEVVESDKDEVIESDKDEVVDSDKGEVAESDKHEAVESDKEDVVESDKEVVRESDKEDVVESDKEEVMESDKEEVVESDVEEVVESDNEEAGKKKEVESGKKKAGESDKKKEIESGKKKEVESGKKKWVVSVKEEATKEKEKSDEEDSKQESANGDDSLQVFSDDDEPSSPVIVISSDEDEDSDNNSKAVPAKSKIKSKDSSSSPDLALSKGSKRASRMRQAAAKADVLGSIDDDDSLSPFKVPGKKSNKLSAPFKTPKKVLFKDEPISKKHSEEDSSDENDLPAKPSKDVKKEKSFSSTKKEKTTPRVSEGDVGCMDDYKLGPHVSYVSMETLSDLILDRLRTEKFVIVKESDSDNDSKKGRRGRPRRQKEPDDPLTKALKKLASFNPYINKTNKRTPSSSKSAKEGRSKSSRTKIRDDDDELVRDDQTTEGSSDDEPVLKRNIQPIIPAKSKYQDKDSDVELVGSDDEELDGRVSSSDEGAARKSVLRNTRSVKKELLSEDDEKKPKKSGGKRKKGGSYYTPQVCKVPELVDSEDSDDDFISKKRKLTKKAKKTVINSESEDDDDSSGEKKQHKSKYVELSSDSDNSDSDRNTRSSKKKRRVSSSDSDYQQKKRRKRIKAMSDSDDDGKRKRKKKKKKGSDVEVLSGSDSDVKEISEDAGAKGRKKIRGIMDKSDLQRETRRAEEEEEKRKKRVVERQSHFNELFKAPETEVIEQLVLDYDPENKEPLVSVDPSIAKKLKPHQVKGITFIFNACFESVEQFKKPDAIGSGCILAHCMGLGKTLQTIAFIHSVMTNDLLKIKSVLIMCPLNTVGNWNNELRMWLRDADKRVNVHRLYEEKNVPNRVQALQGWRRRGGVGIMHYDAFRGLVEGKKIKKHHKTIIQECLLDPGPDVVICDEGHVFKNDKSKISVAVNKIRTRRRVVLTGTPLQNNLLEYHCMMQFVKPNLLGSKKEFSNRFVNPITNGQHKDSTSYDVSIMKKRAHVLHKLLDGCVQRLDYNVLLPYLPPKYEYVVLINMTEIQKTLYVHYLDSIKEHKSVQELIKGGLLLKHSANLAKVWCHPYALVLKHNQNNAISTGSESLGSLEDFIDDRSDDTPASDSDVDWLDEHSQVMKKKKEKENNENGVKTEDGNSDSNPLPEKDQLSGELINNGGDWWSKFFKSKGEIQLLEHSSKMVVLLDIIKTCEGIQDKVLVFSQYLYSLNMIEEFLETMDEEAKQNQSQDTFPVFPKAQDFSQRWRKNIEYFRIDGSTKTEDRQKNCDMFNKTDTSRAKLFLISTKAGGLGINLVGANRVVIFDASWNPSQDMQSIFRVFRFGQIKPCYIYRLLAKGTIEEKIYNRQVVKLSLSGRVVDEHQIERHFTFDDMAKMYEFEPDEKADRPTPPVPKDRLLADLLMTHKDMIDTYLEHDSLLENIQGEELTEEERKVAWDEYQNEKNNLRNNINMNMNPNMIHNAFHSMMTSATQIEVEQAYDKMKGKIREMYPHLSPEEFMMYTLKVQKDVDDLRKFTYQFHERHMAFTDTLRKRWIEVLQEKKKAIQTYFTIPGALQREMMSHYAPVNTVNYNQAPAQPIIEGPISVVPLSNILEQNSPYVPGNPNMHQNVYMSANNVRNMSTYRPSILHRGRNVIPTTTVPYTPTPNNQPSTSYSNEPIDLD